MADNRDGRRNIEKKGILLLSVGFNYSLMTFYFVLLKITFFTHKDLVIGRAPHIMDIFVSFI